MIQIAKVTRLDKNVFPGKDFLENSATIIRFEYFSLGKQLKAETDIEKKQYKRLDNTYEFDKIIKIEKPTFKKYNRQTLIYNSRYKFYPYHNNKHLSIKIFAFTFVLERFK